MTMEIERKYLDANLESAAAGLAALGAISGGRHFERNFIYDTPACDLRAIGRLLRLRLMLWPNKSLCHFTMKLKPDAAALAANVKAREEIELAIDDFAAMSRILTELGYTRIVIYEKVREEMTLDWHDPKTGKICGMKIALDRLPFCKCIEIEGNPACIDAVAAALGLDKSRSGIKSYYELHQDWLAANGVDHGQPGFQFNAGNFPADSPELAAIWAKSRL